MLTRKQRELLLFINQRLTATGVSPSFDEMKDALNLKSKSGIHRLVSGLEERGFIRRLPHRARALEVVKLPEESAAPPPAGERGRFSPTVIRGDFASSLPGAPVANDVEAVDLPLYGRIAAGTPIEALRDQSTTVGVPASILSRSSEHYALEVAGDSMIDAGILHGDTVIVQRSDTAENAVVVALIDNDEVTLKRLRSHGAAPALEPANKAYDTRIFGPDRAKNQRRLV